MKVKSFLSDTTIIKNEEFILAPEVSVIMPTYCRGGSQLVRAIESVLHQTFTNFEFIIVDDGSRDSTFDLLKHYQQLDKRIIIIHHELNSGLPGLRINEGILAARGKYIAYQFDDDEYLPDCLSALYQRIILEKEPCLVFGASSMYTLTDTETRVSRSLGHTDFNFSDLMNSNLVANNAVMHHKQVIELCGLYDPNIAIRRLSDYDLWLRMSKKVPFYRINQTITNVYAGEKHSLGTDIAIDNMLILRRYLEINRDDLLKPNTLLEYDIDGLKNYPEYFTSDEIDYNNRHEIIPFKSKLTYLIPQKEHQTFAISRSKNKHVLVTKLVYSTSIDVALKNYMCEINNFPYKYVFLSEKLLGLLSADDYDMSILYRTIDDYSTAFLKNSLNLNKPVAYLLDDNMFKFHELGPAFKYLTPGLPRFANLKFQVQRADLVMSYSPAITQNCKVHSQKVYELKTNLSLKYFIKKPSSARANRKIRFGIFSGPVRTAEIKFLWETLEKLSEKYKDQIILEFWGINPSDFGNLYCEVIFKPFTNNYNLYLETLLNNDFDFQICPLLDDLQVKQSKSPIKLLEGTVCGSVGIFSDVIPYNQIPDSLCFKTKNTPESWYNTLEKAILSSEESRYDMYTEAFNYVTTKYSTEAQVFNVLGALEAMQLHSHLKGKKIAYMFHESYLGGATLHLFRHARMLQSIGAQVLLCLGENQRSIDALPNLVKSFGFSIHYLPYKILVSPTNFGEGHRQDAETISNWLIDNNVGMIHEATFIPTVGLAAQYAKIPNIASLHQYYPNTSGKFDRRFSNIQAVHSSSNRYATLWQKTLGAPAHRIVCPVDTEFFDLYNNNLCNAQTLWDSPKPINILVSGTLQTRKNQLEAIKAVKLLRDKGYPITLDLIGYDNLRADYLALCKEEIAQNNLEEFITIHGFCDTPQIYYKEKAHILLCCSTDESMPQTILQAMAAGLFVITSPVGGVEEIIKDNYNGLVTSGTNASDLAEAIERLFKFNSNYRLDLLVNAHATISTLGSYDFVRSELLYLYNKGFDRFNAQV